jgi:hypothetical protein
MGKPPFVPRKNGKKIQKDKQRNKREPIAVLFEEDNRE